MKIGRSMVVGAGLLALGCVSALAQQVTGVPGSPGATTTIDGKQLPPPDPKFGGVIREKASKSQPWWPPRIVPPKGAPNVLLIMTDDQGFGAPSTFGGVIPTPAMDRGRRTMGALQERGSWTGRRYYSGRRTWGGRGLTGEGAREGGKGGGWRQRGWPRRVM